MELASRIDEYQSFVAKYENGERRLDVIEFIEICSVLGVDPGRLVAKLAKSLLR